MSQTDLSTCEKGLIFTATAIASGCKPCTARTVYHARKAGASQEAINRALVIGLDVKHTVYHDMHQEAQKHGEISTDELRRNGFKGETCLEWFMATGAAFAANFTIGLERYSAAAEQLGATASVLNIAHRVKEQAGREAERTAAMVVPVNQHEKSVSGGCDCMSDRKEEATPCCS